MNAARILLLSFAFYICTCHGGGGGVRAGAVEGSACCRVHAIAGSWLEFPRQGRPSLPFLGVGDLVLDMSEKFETLSCPPTGCQKPLYARYE